MSEKRYIDANSLILSFDEGIQGTAREYMKFFVMAINNQPAADVVESVHCRDCIHHTKDKNAKWVQCPIEALRGINDNGYCHFGDKGR